MDRANAALAKASNAREQLHRLQAELADLEASAGRGAGAADLTLLGTSIDDLARTHEQHGANMRAFGAAVDPQSQPPLPTPSAEPRLPPDSRERAATAATASSADASLTRPAFDRPLGSAPMQRSYGERREMAAAATQRSQAATEARYAQLGAQARQRVEAARQRQETRSQYLLERDGIDADRAAAALAAAAARVESQAAASQRGSGSGRPQSARAALSTGSGSVSASNLGSGAAPVTAIRMPLATDRPTSAPKERPRVTVPVPFSFEHRPRRDTAAERRMRSELVEERRSLELAQRENKARDLPPTTAPGLYSEMVAEAEAASRDRRQQRRTVPVPFSFAHRETRQAKRVADTQPARPSSKENVDTAAYANVDAGDAPAGGLWVERGEAVGERKSFRARDVPRSMSEPRWEMMRVQEAERRERVAQEALKSAQRSKLPPRMQLHKETSRARKAAEAERIQAEIDSELTLKPQITNEVPDFDRLHLNFEKELQRKRQSYRQTNPKPFRMESEPYRLIARENKQVKDEMILRDMRRDELVMPERRWPYLSTQAPIGRKPMPDFSKQHAAWKDKSPNADTTEKLQAMQSKLLDQKRAEDRAQRAEKEAAKQRQENQKKVTEKVSSRLKEVAGDVREIKKAAREEQQRRREEHRQAWKERQQAVNEQMEEMRKRVEARPFLFEQASIDVAVEKAKAQALDRFDDALKKAGLSDRLQG